MQEFYELDGRVRRQILKMPLTKRESPFEQYEPRAALFRCYVTFSR